MHVNHTKRWTVCRLHGLHAVVLVLSACKSDCLYTAACTGSNNAPKETQTKETLRDVKKSFFNVSNCGFNIFGPTKSMKVQP